MSCKGRYVTDVPCGFSGFLAELQNTTIIPCRVVWEKYNVIANDVCTGHDYRELTRCFRGQPSKYMEMQACVTPQGQSVSCLIMVLDRLV